MTSHAVRDPLPDVDRYLQAVSRLRLETIRRMAALQHEEPSIELELARRAASRAITSAGRRDLWQDVRRA